MLIRFLLPLICGFAISVAIAQEPVPATLPQPANNVVTTAPAASTSRLLAEGTPVRLKFMNALSSKTALDGDPVDLELTEDLLVDGNVLAKAGAVALGTVLHARKSGMLGRAGELSIRLEYLKCDEKRVRIRGTQAREGEGKEGATVALTVLFGPIGLIKHGKNVEIKAGQVMVAYVDDDYHFDAPLNDSQRGHQ